MYAFICFVYLCQRVSVFAVSVIAKLSIKIAAKSFQNEKTCHIDIIVWFPDFI